MKEQIIKLLKKAIEKKDILLRKEEIEKFLEIPPSLEMGDYAFPCFFLAGKLKKSPNQIALELKEKIKTLPKNLDSVQTSGPYINFFVNRKELARKLISDITKQKNNFGKLKKTGEKVMVEFTSPNTNKPLHLGHLRNMAIGESVSRISEFNGDKVIRASLNNDRGAHINKSIVAYNLYGKNKTPKKIKSDHFVGNFYVMFNKKAKKNKKLEIQAQNLLQKWEQGDKETIAVWKKMNKWALKGFHETYKTFGIKFNKEYFESKIYVKGKKIIFNGLKKSVFEKRKDGAIIINLDKQGLGEKVLLRPDNTSVYITQDIYLAYLKSKKHNLNKSIYVTGDEQDYHFNVLFTILKKLKFKQAENLKHLSYGMVYLPEGKMKSREGTIVDADNLIKKVKELVKKELKSRNKLSKKVLDIKSLKIALAAIKYFLLKIDVKKSMLFNPKESINFQGNTGPYLLYSYARASSILKKSQSKIKQFKIINLEQKEFELVNKISKFPEIVLNSYKNLNPSVIANYSYSLAQTFNEFYHTHPVIGAEQESFRLALVQAFKQTIKNSLHLLGIDLLEEM